MPLSLNRDGLVLLDYLLFAGPRKFLNRLDQGGGGGGLLAVDKLTASGKYLREARFMVKGFGSGLFQA